MIRCHDDGRPHTCIIRRAARTRAAHKNSVPLKLQHAWTCARPASRRRSGGDAPCARRRRQRRRRRRRVARGGAFALCSAGRCRARPLHSAASGCHVARRDRGPLRIEPRTRGRGERELEYELRPCQHTHARFDGIEQPSASRLRPPLAELSRLVAAGNAVAREEVSALDVDRCALAVRAWCALGDAIAGDTRIRPRSVSNS